MKSLPLAALLALVVACSSAPSVSRCTPGASVACVCPGVGTGAQVCAADGASYGACACGVDAGGDTSVTPGADATSGADVVAIPDVPALDVVTAEDRPAAVDAVAVVDADPVDAVDVADVPQDALRDVGCDANTSRDPVNCGACGNVCAAEGPNTVPSCVDGRCRVTCAAGWGTCGAGGGCPANLLTGTPGGNGQVGNCGTCGATCTFTNAGSQCLAGTCVIGACTGSFRNCNGDQMDGCEANTQTEVAHCGACGQSCGGRFPNATPTCTAGTCFLASCNAGFANCNNMASDGCEIDTRNNPSHCGRCGGACAAGQQCINSVCMLVCPVGQVNCSGRCVDLATDAVHCGQCGNACAAGTVCVARMCTIVCPPGQRLCGSRCVDSDAGC